MYMDILEVILLYHVMIKHNYVTFCKNLHVCILHYIASWLATFNFITDLSIFKCFTLNVCCVVISNYCANYYPVIGNY